MGEGHQRRRAEQYLARALIALLLLASLPSVSGDSNDPGHDTLYVVKAGDSTVTGSINVSNEIIAGNVRYATLLYGDLLDIRANGTVLSPTSRPAIQATTNSLYIDGNGNLYINTRAGTTGIIQMGSTSTNDLTLNVSGTIRQQNTRVCLENGTNCPGTLSESNVSGSGTSNYLARWAAPGALESSIIYDDGTSVGIGTTAPTQMLDVNGSINISGVNAKAHTPEFCLNTDCRTTWPASGYEQWRLAASTGSTANITNNTLVNITNGTMITTSLSSTTLTIANAYGSAIDASELASTTGTGAVVLNSSPTLSSPTITGAGSITATSGAFTTLTRGGQAVCTDDGGNCPSTLSDANVAGTGTMNYLALWESENDLATSILYQNSTHIGIGTTAPATTLHLIGNLTVEGGAETQNANQTGKSFVLIAGAGSDTDISANTGRAGGNITIRAGQGGDSTTAAGGNGGSLLLYGGSAGSETGGVGGSIYLTPGNGEGGNGATITSGTVNLSNALHIPITGNIGIGTTAPGADLHINGTSNPTIRISTGLAGDRVLQISKVADALYLDDLGVKTLQAWNLSSGNSVVGTSSTSGDSTYVLEVFGAAPQLGISGSTNGVGQNATLGFMQKTTTSVTRAGGAIKSVATGTYTAGDGATYLADLAFLTGNQGTNIERVRITSAGNVGVGTTGPARQLHINDTVRIEPRSSAPTSPALGDLYVDSDTKTLCFYNSTSWVGMNGNGACA